VDLMLTEPSHPYSNLSLMQVTLIFNRRYHINQIDDILILRFINNKHLNPHLLHHAHMPVLRILYRPDL
jgi:hypothetical protein